jgi:hypothetical protein
LNDCDFGHGESSLVAADHNSKLCRIPGNILARRFPRPVISAASNDHSAPELTDPIRYAEESFPRRRPVPHRRFEPTGGETGREIKLPFESLDHVWK